jgi:hypothetical protein
MDLFHRMAYLAAANLMGASAELRISNQQLSAELEQMALSDPELAEHYARMMAALPALAAQRAVEDAEVKSAQQVPPIERPRAA